MTSRKRLLVEGDSDKFLFDALLREKGLTNVDVDSVDSVAYSSISGGNRKRVEAVCDAVIQQNPGLFSKLLGFVDREFRGLSLSVEMGQIARPEWTHYREQNVVRSLGHSLENYLFASQVITRAARVFTNPRKVKDEADRLFFLSYEEVCRCSCMVSLLAFLLSSEKRVFATVQHKIFGIVGDTIVWDKLAWSKLIVEQHLADSTEEWLAKIEALERLAGEASMSLEDFRLLSHGHIGLRYLWCAYAVAAGEAAARMGEKREAAVQAILKNGEATLFNATVEAWLALQPSLDSNHLIEPVLKFAQVA